MQENQQQRSQRQASGRVQSAAGPAPVCRGARLTAPDLGDEVVVHEKPYWEVTFADCELRSRPRDVLRDCDFAGTCVAARSTGDGGERCAMSWVTFTCRRIR
ncbi:hypothetical protein BZL30_1806 [Mycobacterium kansasii]|uniref:Uncharacterized protein n=1 Tax=Mycobacterium kansasii TaxID=1768 RepID=A0A1V3XHS2_MYCKA|nr:hypothetical protein BZL30_1806 [Mycobacterium kansasii]OOK80005.1 hypothetical protein BZL29_1865 [Mycobacterium kansasii]